MNKLFCHLFVLLLLSIVLTQSLQAQNQTIEGNWMGAIDVGGSQLRLVLKISKSGDALVAKMDSPDQGANDLPVDSIVQQGKTVRFEATKFGIGYEGTLDEKMGEINGTFKQGANSFALIFKRVTAIAKAARPQDPQRPYPYTEEDVSYKNESDNVKLAGTLTLPRDGKAQHPAVVLITGSGAQDRDETIFGHRPFLVIADYLTRRGIAVLRVDDRGIGGSDLGSRSATSENFAGDVSAGIEYLKTRKEIDTGKIGLLGHSEGGIIAPMIAASSKDVVFIVLLAGTGQTGEDVIYTQSALILKAAGAPPEITEMNTAALKTVYAILKTEPDNKAADKKIREALDKQLSEMSGERQQLFAAVKTEAEKQIPIASSAWYRYFIGYDPRPALEKVRVPVLAINGENDLQVSAKENLPLIEAALKKGGNKDYTIKSFPKLNHLFQTSTTGAIGEYGTIEETISPEVLETIASWIVKRTIEK